MPFSILGPYQGIAENIALSSKGRKKMINVTKKVVSQQSAAYKGAAKQTRESAFANPDRTRQQLMQQEGLGTYDAKQGRWNFKSRPDSIVDFAVKNPRMFAEIMGTSLAQDYIKSAAPIALSMATGGTLPLNAAQDITNKTVNKPIMEATLNAAPISQKTKDIMGPDWVAPGTATTFVDPAFTAFNVTTGGSTLMAPAAIKVTKTVEAVAKAEKTAKAAKTLAKYPKAAGAAGTLVGLGLYSQVQPDEANANSYSALIKGVEATRYKTMLHPEGMQFSKSALQHIADRAVSEAQFQRHTARLSAGIPSFAYSTSRNPLITKAVWDFTKGIDSPEAWAFLQNFYPDSVLKDIEAGKYPTAVDLAENSKRAGNIAAGANQRARQVHRLPKDTPNTPNYVPLTQDIVMKSNQDLVEQQRRAEDMGFGEAALYGLKSEQGHLVTPISEGGPHRAISTRFGPETVGAIPGPTNAMQGSMVLLPYISSIAQDLQDLGLASSKGTSALEQAATMQQVGHIPSIKKSIAQRQALMRRGRGRRK